MTRQTAFLLGKCLLTVRTAQGRLDIRRELPRRRDFPRLRLLFEILGEEVRPRLDAPMSAWSPAPANASILRYSTHQRDFFSTGS